MGRTLPLTLLCLLLGAFPVQADEPPAPEAPPTLEVGRSRASTGWVTLPSGSRVAVDKSVTWKGVRVYMSLTYDLVGVDAETGKVLYGQNISAFWGRLTFVEVTPTGGAKQWAIEMAPRAGRAEGADKREYRSLRTGAKLDVKSAAEENLGEPLKLRLHYSGDRCEIAKPFCVLVSCPASWKILRARMFGGAPEASPEPAFGAIDFAKEVVIAVCAGNSSNSRGIGLLGAFENESRLLVRTERQSFQTMNGYQKARPWGVFVVPRRDAKRYEVQRNAQGLIGGPALWKTRCAFPRVGPVAEELQSLPPRAATPHHGWEKSMPRELPPPRRPR